MILQSTFPATPFIGNKKRFLESPGGSKCCHISKTNLSINYQLTTKIAAPTALKPPHERVPLYAGKRKRHLVLLYSMP